MDSGFGAFDALTADLRGSRAALNERVRHGSLSQEHLELLTARGLAHVSHIALGLRLSIRADTLRRDEARALLVADHVVSAARPGSTEALAAQRAPEALVAFGRPRLRSPGADPIAAISQARLVFALIPRLPPNVVSWPGQAPSYADVLGPRDLEGMLQRIDELEATLLAVAMGHDGPFGQHLRRTYAYFETAVWLRTDGLRQPPD